MSNFSTFVQSGSIALHRFSNAPVAADIRAYSGACSGAAKSFSAAPVVAAGRASASPVRSGGDER